MQLRALVLTLLCAVAGAATMLITPPGPAQRAELFALTMFALLAALGSLPGTARAVAATAATQRSG
jgi:cytochrome c556